MEQDLLKAGYREYKGYSGTDQFFQKAIRKDGVKLYFINIQKWVMMHPRPFLEVYQADVRFYLSDDDPLGFQVELYEIQDKTVEEVEAFFAEVYSKLGCVPDIHNN